jgi:hypothetical protein
MLFRVAALLTVMVAGCAGAQESPFRSIAPRPVQPPPPPAEPRADVSIQTFVAPGASIGARTTRYATDDPEMTGALSVAWRRRVGAARFGGAAGVRFAEHGYAATPWTAVAAWGVQPTRWLAVDLQGELGALFLFARPELSNYNEGSEYLWTPLAAGQAEASWRLGASAELSLALRTEVRMPREVERTTTFCNLYCMAETDTWSLGGAAVGAVLGLRFLIR